MSIVTGGVGVRDAEDRGLGTGRGVGTIEEGGEVILGEREGRTRDDAKEDEDEGDLGIEIIMKDTMKMKVN